LTRPFRLDVHLELDLARAFWRDGQEAAAIADSAAERARIAGDETGETLARVAEAFHRCWYAPDPAVDELETLARSALPLLEEARDHTGLVHVWWALGFGVANFRGRWDDWAHAAEQARRHARIAGVSTHLFVELALASGSRPADEALRTLDALLDENPRPLALLVRAWLLAMLGRFGEAWPIAHVARGRERELMGVNMSEWLPAQIAALEGDHETAARYLRRLCDLLEELDQRMYLSSAAPMLGRELCSLGRYDEAERCARLVRELDVRQNVLGQAGSRQVQALVHASRGAHAEAEALAHEALNLIDRTDGLNYQAEARCDLAEVLAAAGRTDEAAAALEQALDRYEHKQNLAIVAQVRPRLEALRAS
jgi:tetratricopeptide (TPR) repeat protein